MNMIFKIMVFSILLNFAVGIMLNTIVDKDGNDVFSLGTSGGLNYDDAYGADFQGELNSTVSPSGVLEDKGNAIYRILDTLNLGFIAKLILAAEKYMFGFVNMLYSIFAPKLGEESASFIFGVMKAIIGIGYALGAWYLWTGKSIND